MSCLFKLNHGDSIHIGIFFLKMSMPDKETASKAHGNYTLPICKETL